MKDQRNPVVWNEDCETAFQALKSCLCSSPVLRSPDFEQRFLVQTDASAVGLGVVLAQGDPGEERPPFQFQIRHRAGKTNVVADYLSRLPHIVNLGEEGDNVTERQ
uniref:Reverse transcriptase/retrotransposon-derived protein RNase H-like domain-containing protein n=1 Tax=Knipowitschia caucasica TaxID=637954 RepID=A0AAV2JY02_KNICA